MLTLPASLGTVSLVVRDYDEARSFFVDALRFVVVEDRPAGPGKRWLVVAPEGGRGAGLLLAKAVGPRQSARIGDQAGGRVGFFLETDDFAAMQAHMQARGVVFEEAARHETYGIVAVFRDLYGNRWDLLQPSR